MTAPAPDNYGDKEVYAFFGLAAYSAQVLEKGLVNMVVTFKTFGLRITLAEFDAIFSAHDSRTLGQLLQAARNLQIPIPVETDQLFSQALKKRNYLNHDFFAARSGYFMSETGRRKMIRELRELILLFQTADEHCEPIYRPVLERMGVSEQTIQKLAQDLITKAIHEAEAQNS